MNKSALLSILALSMCSGCFAEEQYDSRRALIEAWGKDIIIPTYNEFESRALILRNLTIDLCKEPSEKTLRRAQIAWWNARSPWKQMEIFAFGPFINEPWRIGPRIDSWPVRVSRIEQVLQNEDAISIDGLGTFQKGFPAIEYLLYPSKIDIVDTFSADQQRCAYLLVAVIDLERGAKEMRRAWDPNYDDFISELTDAGAGSTTFTSLNAAVEEVVNRMAFTVDNIRSEKLGRPLGFPPTGNPQPTKVESQFSGRSLEDIRDNLLGIENIYFGLSSTSSMSLDDLIHSRGIDLGTKMNEHLTKSRSALDNIQIPLTQSIVDSPGDVVRLSDRLRDLQRFIQIDIIGALSLASTFNNSDGD